jgi:hypothetical protein
LGMEPAALVLRATLEDCRKTALGQSNRLRIGFLGWCCGRDLFNVSVSTQRSECSLKREKLVGMLSSNPGLIVLWLNGRPSRTGRRSARANKSPN